MYVPYSRVNQTKPRRPSEGGETKEDQPAASEIVIDPPDKSAFGIIGKKIYSALESMPEPGPLDSEATRPGTEADEAIARAGKRIEQTLDYVGHKIQDLVHVPPPEPFISSEATRPGSEVNVALARVGKHIEEYLHAATVPLKSKAWQETSTALHDAAESMERVPSVGAPLPLPAGDIVGEVVLADTSKSPATKASDTARQAITEPHSTLADATSWTNDGSESLSGAAVEYYKSAKEGVSASQFEKEARRTSGMEKTENLKRAQECREDQSAHASNAKQHLDNLHPRPISSPSQSAPNKPDSILSRIGNWFSGGKG